MSGNKGITPFIKEVDGRYSADKIPYEGEIFGLFNVKLLAHYQGR
jgi:hypothetical protein